jgi:hypothetical protein
VKDGGGVGRSPPGGGCGRGSSGLMLMRAWVNRTDILFVKFTNKNNISELKSGCDFKRQESQLLEEPLMTRFKL